MEFTSKYKTLSFYVNGDRKKFADGTYNTKDPEEIKVLKNLKDVIPEEVKNLEGSTVPKLKELAKEKGIEGYTNMKRDELLNALKGDEDEEQC